MNNIEIDGSYNPGVKKLSVKGQVLNVAVGNGRRVHFGPTDSVPFTQYCHCRVKTVTDYL